MQSSANFFVLCNSQRNYVWLENKLSPYALLSEKYINLACAFDVTVFSLPEWTDRSIFTKKLCVFITANIQQTSKSE